VRVFVAGASGAVGVPLVRQLLEEGHEVVAMTSSPERAGALREQGATPAVCDALEAEAVVEAVRAAGPDAVVNELTRLPARLNFRNKKVYEPTNRLRTEGTRALMEGALAAGARRFVSQSIAFLYAPEGGKVKDEEARAYTEAPEPFGGAIAADLEGEQMTTETEGIDGVVLRYGQFYGPGTFYASDGTMAQDVRKRRFPIVGRGDGLFSFIHVEDAAAATVAAVAGGAGIYNIVDDEPTPLREWLPVYAEAVGAKTPRRVPTWVAALVAGRVAAGMATTLRGASNAKAKAELDWTLRYPSWRQGFREALG
jgi:2-alkyl-3-oxoalkanoate reductase